MRRLLLLVLFLAACAPPFQPGRPHTGSHAPPLAPSDTLTVVSYNVQYGEDLAGALRDLTGHARLREASILCLQEMQPEGVEYIAAELGYDYVYYAAAISPHHGKLFGNAILSRWPVVGHRLLELPRGGPHTGTQRVAVSTEIDLGDETLHVVSTHTATPLLRWKRRLEQMRTVIRAAAPLDDPVIVAGDFNTVTRGEVSQLRRAFRQEGFEDAHLPPGGTAHPKWTARIAGEIPLRLDHVYHRGFQWVDSGIVTEAEASDHLPVWVRLVQR